MATSPSETCPEGGFNSSPPRRKAHFSFTSDVLTLKYANINVTWFKTYRKHHLVPTPMFGHVMNKSNSTNCLYIKTPRQDETNNSCTFIQHTFIEFRDDFCMQTRIESNNLGPEHRVFHTVTEPMVQLTTFSCVGPDGMAGLVVFTCHWCLQETTGAGGRAGQWSRLVCGGYQ